MVYRGIWLGPGGGKVVAVKEVFKIALVHININASKIYLNSINRVDKLIDEVRVMASLHHPCICPVYGYSNLTETNVRLAIPFFPEGDLMRYLDKHPVWEVKLRYKLCARSIYIYLNCFRFALDAAIAINYLHSQAPPFLHRDIKAQNCLVQEVNGEMHLVLTDFGLTKYTYQATNTRGTDNWMAPEVSANMC